MPTGQTAKLADLFQTQFTQRWGHLNDIHVRALAWLLDAPDLLDPQAPQWQGKIASLQGSLPHDLQAWLQKLDDDPAALHRYLDVQAFTRLGRYAEKLLAYYFEYRGVLAAHGVQVRAGKNSTIGEFDFLLREGDALLHWEFATKFYLLESSGAGEDADYFVGPNLADTLGAKMHKILERQLLLSQHPAAQVHLPVPVAQAQALVKGWLFYHKDDTAADAATFGISAEHCRGFWCALGELEQVSAARYAVLPRLHWLAPAKLDLSQTMDKQSLQQLLAAHFVHDTMPVLVVLLDVKGEVAVESSRGFIVPDDWRTRAGQRIKLVHPPT
ncbi:hypothetical protein D3C87_336500 [compost metagenome]